jgi:hypothetical protein
MSLYSGRGSGALAAHSQEYSGAVAYTFQPLEKLEGHVCVSAQFALCRLRKSLLIVCGSGQYGMNELHGGSPRSARRSDKTCSVKQAESTPFFPIISRYHHLLAHYPAENVRWKHLFSKIF